MKVNVLKKLIAEVVRKEVKVVVREELAKFKMDDVLGESKSPSLSDAVQPKKMVQPKNKKQYTSNSALNEILNSTVGGIQQGGDGIENIYEGVDANNEEWPSLGGQTMTTSNYGAMMNGGIPNQNNQNAQSVAHLPDDNPVKRALTRNYGDVMAAVEKKKGGSPLKG